MSDANHRIGPAPDDPETYVRKNRDSLIRVIRHGDDPFTRGLAIAALIEYGPDPSVDRQLTISNGWGVPVGIPARSHLAWNH